MRIVNDTPRSPLRYITRTGEVIGQFYNSWDRLYHLAAYEPDRRPPYSYLCGQSGNFSPSREDRADLNRCQECFCVIKEIEASET